MDYKEKTSKNIFYIYNWNWKKKSKTKRKIHKK